MITPEMLNKGYINVDSLINEANMQQAAEASQEAFAKLLESKGAGSASSKTIMALLGLGGKDKDGKALAPDMGDAVSSLMGAMDTALQKKDAYTGMGQTVAQNLSTAIQNGLGGVDFVQVIVGTIFNQLLATAQAQGWGSKP